MSKKRPFCFYPSFCALSKEKADGFSLYDGCFFGFKFSMADGDFLFGEGIASHVPRTVKKAVYDIDGDAQLAVREEQTDVVRLFHFGSPIDFIGQHLFRNG